MNRKEITLKGNNDIRADRLYRIWLGILYRCKTNTDYMAYKNYGGRGISVCDEWKNDFNTFYNWAINNRL